MAVEMPEWKNVPIREEIWDILEKRAKEENRSLANLVETILKQSLKLEVRA